MEYKGYTIKQEFNHYIIINPEGQIISRTDTVEEAKQEIDEMEEGE